MTQVKITTSKKSKVSLTSKPSAALPINKFMKHFKERDYKEARAISGQLSAAELEKPSVTFRLGVIYLHYGKLKKAKPV